MKKNARLEQTGAKALELLDGDIFVNIQGDEPLIEPDAIDTLIRNHNKEIGVSNAYVVLDRDELWHKLHDQNVVKCVIDMYDNAMYYSRFGIPYDKGEEPCFFQQLGMYVFNRETLEQFAHMPIGPVEKAEGIEMIRFLENSWTVNMVEVQDEGLSVDTQKDLKRVENYLDAQIKKSLSSAEIEENNLQSEEIFHFEHSPRRLQETKDTFHKIVANGSVPYLTTFEELRDMGYILNDTDDEYSYKYINQYVDTLYATSNHHLMVEVMIYLRKKITGHFIVVK